MTGAADKSNAFHRLVRLAIPTAILIVGTGFSILAFWEAQQADDQRVRDSLELRAAWRARDFQDKFNDTAVPVESIATLFASRKSVDADEFHAFASAAKDANPVARLMWAPVVLDADRPAFEAAAGRESADDAIRKFDAQGTMIRVGARDMYLPVQYEQSFENTPPLLGFDYLSEPVRRAAAEQARDQGTAIVTPALASLPGQGSAQRFTLYWPVYRRGVIPTSVADRRQQIVGFAIGSFSISAVFEFSLRNTPSIFETLSLIIGDTPNAPMGIPAAQYRSESHTVVTDAEALGESETGGLRLTHTFEEFGRHWTLVSDYAPRTVAGLRSPTRWGYLALGLILTAALAAYVAAQQRRQTVIEALVAKRTSDLDRAADQVQAMIASSPLATGSADTEGRVILWNRAAERTFGFAAHEVIGKANPVTPDNDLAPTQAVIARILRGEILHGVELPLKTKDRGMIDGSVSAAAFHDSKGVPQGIVFTIEDITERKHAQRQIAEERDTAQRYLDVAGVMILTLNPDATVKLINSRGCAILGYDGPDELVGRNWLDVCVPEHTRPSVSVFWRRLIDEADASIAFNENPVLTKSGEERIIAWHNRVLTDDQGRVVGVLSSGEDVTERKRTEEELRRSLDHLARGQRIGGWGSIETDFQTGAVRWSDALYRLLGLEPGAVEPNFNRILDLVHPDDREKVHEGREELAHGQTPAAPIEFRIVHPNGQIRWLHRLAEIVRDEHGRPLRRVVTLHDITERKAADDARRASEEQYRLTFDLAPLGIAHVGLDARYLVVNETLCTMFGASREEMLASDFRKFTHPDYLAASDEYVRRLIAREQPVASWDKRYVLTDGRDIWCHITSMLKRDEAGRPEYFVSTYEDITERKKMEVRRAELEEQLQQSQKMEAVGRLTGGVAHDFNNLLTVVLGNLELVREQVEDNPKVVRQVDSALMAGQRGADLTQRLLAFSRRQPLDPVIVDINKRIGELVPMLHRTLGETIDIKPKLGEALWRVMVDPGQLESAILNLAVNSRDAMPDGGTLEITTENIAVDDAYVAHRPDLAMGDYVRVSVSDSGTGMPPDVVDKAFEPFFTTKDVGKGTGLGLSMVYGFVKQTGGHAAIYSEVGIGTTITLLLPADPTANADFVEKTVSVPQRGSETILVVEDDSAVRTVTVSFLEALGYHVIHAGTVAEGFDIFASNPNIDAILTDVILPGGEDGATLARRARAQRADVKILFMSGYTEDVVMHNGRLDAGVVLLRKPFTRGQLAQKIRTVIDGVTTA